MSSSNFPDIHYLKYKQTDRQTNKEIKRLVREVILGVLFQL